MSNLMKRLTIGDASYEICDASAREALEKIGTGVSSWNDLGYSYSVMTWDGTTDGRECFTTSSPTSLTLNYYKISDTYLPADKFVGGTMIVSGVEDINSFVESQGGGELLPAEVQITEDMIVFADNGYAVVGMNEYMPLIMSVTAEYAASQSIDISEGTYALLADAEVVNQLLAELGGVLTLKDNIFLKELKILEKINLIPEDLIPEISWKNLSDKPFYEDDSTREVLIEPATYEVNGASAHGVVKIVTFYDLEHQLEDGEVYTIVIDGKEYVETAKRHGDGDVNYSIYIGDFNVVTSEAEGWCFTVYYNDLGGCTKSLYVYNNTEEWDTFNVALYKGVSEYHTLDEKFIPDTIARKDDLTWDNLGNKPFGSNQTVIEWDGNTDGRDVVVSDDGNNYYYISDIIPTAEELLGASVKAYMYADGSTMEMVISEEFIDDTDDVLGVATGVVMIAKTDGADYAKTYTFPKAGIYFRQFVGSHYPKSLTYGSVKTLDEQYIPDTIARANSIPAIADLTAAPTMEDFNNLLAALRNAGLMATE